MENSIGSPESATLTPGETVQSSQIIEEGPRICPLCSSEIRLFFINFNEKMLMCENTECEFPFGYEDLQFVRTDNDEDLSEILSVRSRPNLVSPNGSIVSTATWSEIDKLNRMFETEDSQSAEPRPFDRSTHTRRNSKRSGINKERENQIQKNVKEIQGLTMELKEFSGINETIRNERWIKNLMVLQDQTDRKLLKPQEIGRFKKTNANNNNTDELKIDIAPANETSISSIKIEITNKTS